MVAGTLALYTHGLPYTGKAEGELSSRYNPGR